MDVTCSGGAVKTVTNLAEECDESISHPAAAFVGCLCM